MVEIFAEEIDVSVRWGILCLDDTLLDACGLENTETSEWQKIGDVGRYVWYVPALLQE